MCDCVCARAHVHECPYDRVCVCVCVCMCVYVCGRVVRGAHARDDLRDGCLRWLSRAFVLAAWSQVGT
jgi:hypothetical protein